MREGLKILSERKQIMINSGNHIRDMEVSPQGCVEKEVDEEINSDVRAIGSIYESQENSGTKRRPRKHNIDADDEMQVSLRNDMSELKHYRKGKVKL